MEMNASSELSSRRRWNKISKPFNLNRMTIGLLSKEVLQKELMKFKKKFKASFLKSLRRK